MVCRSTPGNSAVTSFARLASGIDDVQVLSLFHELRNAAPDTAFAPARDEWHRTVDSFATDVATDTDLSDARRASILERLNVARHAATPDGATYYALQTISDRARRARSAVDAHIAHLANHYGLSTTQVRDQVQTLIDSNREAGRSAPRPGDDLPFNDSNLPHDRATLYALEQVYAAPPTGARTTVPAAFSGRAVNCPDCGQFSGPEHQCPTSISTAAQANTQTGHANDRDELQALRDALRNTTEPDAATAAEPTPAPTAPTARSTRRPRTPVRTYATPHARTTMTNLSQVRDDARAGQITVEDVSVLYPNPDGGPAARVTGAVTVNDIGRRRPRGTDRYTVGTPEDRPLQCSCPQYQQTYRCPHVDNATNQITAVLNDRDQSATAPQAALDAATDDLTGAYDQSLVERQAAREQFDAAQPVSYAADMDAFQSAWDQARQRIANGDVTLPYLRGDNVLGGLGSREGGRSFGVELEVDFPDDMTYQAKYAVARDLYEAGLAESPDVHNWHWRARQVDSRNRQMGGGYTDRPNTWGVEFDRSVDPVGGRRGCEIVSPILYDEAQTWENLAKVCEIVQRHGGRATTMTGGHVNVGAADYDHDIANHNRLLRMATNYEDVLLRVAHNPQAGDTHRGREFCGPSVVPATGYRSIGQAQTRNGHYGMVNLGHVPAEGQPITHSTRVEVRLFDGSVDPGRIQHNVAVSLGLVNAAARGVEPHGDAEPAGTHRARNTGGRDGRPRRLTGEAWREDTQSVREFADRVFSDVRNKEQLVAAFASTRWQS